MNAGLKLILALVLCSVCSAMVLRKREETSFKLRIFFKKHPLKQNNIAYGMSMSPKALATNTTIHVIHHSEALDAMAYGVLYLAYGVMLLALAAFTVILLRMLQSTWMMMEKVIDGLLKKKNNKIISS
ncbi:hypothetical protein DdX_20322 [Ditylenchus destructor]|uniref:NADH dehydrogenase subunit 6 n=1 Tax=Ditylenchus destructor TaxID=166010 RepID=A0AAD4MHE4_9BILA|nr:hypothetical protein DdX_20322 [Ditylenchus destructor]